jgi:all-trans-8'-apo-beta-carotenal 15,15'-oxygenase
MLTRRESVLLLGAAGGTAIVGGDAAGARSSDAMPTLSPDRAWLALLGHNVEIEGDYAPEVEGVLPLGLSGTLYRNGPGLFERNGFKKWSLLDGDGMIHALTFAGDSVHFRNRFVRTAKYEQESKAGRFLHPTWTTPAPTLLENIPGGPSLSQAGVAAIVKQGRLYAFDEVGIPYNVDPASLETLSQSDPYDLPSGEGPSNYKAHTKTDGETGAWVLVGGRGGRNPDLHVLIKDAQGRQIAHAVTANPRKHYTYYHDFFWAGRHAVFHLHPAFLSPLPMLLGKPFADCLSWKPAEGSMLVVVDPRCERPAITLEVPAAWMWHSVNAFVSGDSLIADFIGYDAPDHFLGPNAVLRNIMRGRDGTAIQPGTLRRFTVNLGAKRARLETIAHGHFEFPVIHPARVGLRHRYVYVASGNLKNGWFHNGVARIDTDSGARVEYSFGADRCVGEPMFAPDPTVSPLSSAAETSGWLLCEVLDGTRGRSFVAVLDAASLEAGPMAKIQLSHHLPISFHGWWEPA